MRGSRQGHRPRGGRSSHLPPPRERPTGGGVRSTSGAADHRPAGRSPRCRGGYKMTLLKKQASFLDQLQRPGPSLARPRRPPPSRPIGRRRTMTATNKQKHTHTQHNLDAARKQITRSFVGFRLLQPKLRANSRLSLQLRAYIEGDNKLSPDWRAWVFCQHGWQLILPDNTRTSPAHSARTAARLI